MTICLTDHPLEMTILDEAFSSRFHYDRERRKIYGCIYDCLGRRVDRGIRVGGYGGDVIINDDPEASDRPQESVRFEGTTVYLGNLMAQYGHFITEGLSTLWAVPHLKVERAFFHPFIFGDEIPKFMIPLHELFGLGGMDVIVSRQACSFERLIIPERTVILNKSAHIEHRHMIARIVDGIAGAGGKPSRRVFVSRSELKNDRRAFNNSRDVDTLLASLGFEVVHPQKMDIESQIQMFSEVRVLAGSSGSALHNCLFQKSGSSVIEIGSARMPNAHHPMQKLCNMIAGVQEFHIPFRVHESGNADMMFLKECFELAVKEIHDA